MTGPAWQVGDLVAMGPVDGGWLAIPAEQAREELGITEATPGWSFVEVVADPARAPASLPDRVEWTGNIKVYHPARDTPTRPPIEPPEDA